MAALEVFSKSATFKYKSTLCSKSAMFSIAASFLTVTLPFLLAYRSHGFWLRASSYREQPRVHFKHAYLLYLETEQPDRPVLCSNLPVTQDFNYCTLIKSREEDTNRDGHHDELVVEIEAEIPRDLSIYSAQLVLLFDYVLQKHCLLQMEGAGLIQFTSGLPFSKLDVTGDLRLVQRELLRSNVRDTRFNRSVFGLSEDPTTILSLEEAVRSYAARQVSTKIRNQYRSWTRGALLNEPFAMSVRVIYAEDTVHYRPPFWQVAKWAWMQYVAVLVVFVRVGRRIKGYVFDNHLVATVKEVPWKKAP